MIILLVVPVLVLGLVIAAWAGGSMSPRLLSIVLLLLLIAGGALGGVATLAWVLAGGYDDRHVEAIQILAIALSAFVPLVIARLLGLVGRDRKSDDPMDWRSIGVVLMVVGGLGFILPVISIVTPEVPSRVDPIGPGERLAPWAILVAAALTVGVGAWCRTWRVPARSGAESPGMPVET